MPPRVPGYTLAEVLRAFHTDGWTINEGSKHTQARKGNRMVPIPRHRGRDIPPTTMGAIIGLIAQPFVAFR